MTTLKTIELNLQTTLYLTDGDTVLGAYNKHTGILAYNKPLARLDDGLAKMIYVSGATKVFPTDSFDVNFYHHVTGGFSEFHELDDEVLTTV